MIFQNHNLADSEVSYCQLRHLSLSGARFLSYNKNLTMALRSYSYHYIRCDITLCTPTILFKKLMFSYRIAKYQFIMYIPYNSSRWVGHLMTAWGGGALSVTDMHWGQPVLIIVITQCTLIIVTTKITATSLSSWLSLRYDITKCQLYLSLVFKGLKCILTTH